MIKSYKNIVCIEGDRLRILHEFANLYTDLINGAPDIVQAVVLHYQDNLLNAKVNHTAFVICNTFLDNLDRIESEEQNE